MDNLKSEWRRALDVYYAVKKVYIQSEELDEDLSSNVQPLNQLRDALDHFMRVISVQEGLDNTDFSFNEFPSDFAVDNLKSATSHLYRAFFDACDSVSISFREGIRENVKGFSREVIMAAIPTYYSQIRPRVDAINGEIAKMRNLKGQNPNSKSENIEHYISILGELREFYVTTRDAETSLLELKEDEEKKLASAEREKKQSLAVQIIVPVLCAILGFVLGKFF